MRPMTVGSQVKQCAASLRNAEATLRSLNLKSSVKEESQEFEECAQQLNEVITDLSNRIGQLEYEEPQYKGF